YWPCCRGIALRIHPAASLNPTKSYGTRACEQRAVLYHGRLSLVAVLGLRSQDTLKLGWPVPFSHPSSALSNPHSLVHTDALDGTRGDSRVIKLAMTPASVLVSITQGQRVEGDRSPFRPLSVRHVSRHFLPLFLALPTDMALSGPQLSSSALLISIPLNDPRIIERHMDEEYVAILPKSRRIPSRLSSHQA
ncbi:hypothetical protein COCMIDRAFT_103259, partial [Bipolaris oryzae ATCC 44560]